MRALALLLFLLLASAPAPGLADVDNGSFQRWQDDRPAGWTVQVGATRGPGAASRIERGREGGVALVGDARTRSWSSLVQSLRVEPGQVLSLTFEARLLESRREPE